MNAQQLKNSILQLAVQGKLVPQDKNDEPASVLLERIKAEKQALIKAGKIKKEKPLAPITEEEIPFDIPDSWEWIRIGNISSMVTKGTTPRGGNVSYLESGIGFLRAENVAGLDRLDTAKMNYIDEDTHNGFLKRSVLEENDILITIAGTLGRTAIVRKENLPLNANQAISIVRLINTDYFDLFYLICAINSPIIQKMLTLQKKITAIPNLTLEIVSDCLIPIPPLSEQKRIVAKIEELLPYIEKYDEAETKLTELNTKFPDALKKSILQEAVQGKLVPQNPDDEPASVLLEHIKAEKQKLIKEGKIKKEKPLAPIAEDEIPFEIPESWEWCRWGDLSQSIQYGYNAPAKQSGRIKMVRISDIQDNTVLWDSVPYCDIDESDIETYLLQANDILFARTGGTVGKSYLVKEVPEQAIYAGYLIRTRYSNSLCPEYLKFFMESTLYWTQLRNGTIATAQPNCNGKTLSNMILPVPPLEEQKRIVAKIEELMPFIGNLTK
ncbi:restriction endonuclease subunit S [Ruminococcus flavefaciens]|uniref:Type I restriction modification DNA specificity domain-containing protein n=1 Tax=Ruminococcus flavefaciens 007c TaxID=1341157 RepID=W7ULA9_RUMFL|nr:restriction endonuclease subunit S [Ruminococcus flavefaciens]EWM52374.1 hypothetical protein RF007C_13570 [Ruminococcus flavefaciens 007c]